MFPPTFIEPKTIPQLASKAEVEAVLTQLQVSQNTLASLVVMLLISGPIQKILSSFRHT